MTRASSSSIPSTPKKTRYSTTQNTSPVKVSTKRPKITKQQLWEHYRAHARQLMSTQPRIAPSCRHPAKSSLIYKTGTDHDGRLSRYCRQQGCPHKGLQYLSGQLSPAQLEDLHALMPTTTPRKPKFTAPSETNREECERERERRELDELRERVGEVLKFHGADAGLDAIDEVIFMGRDLEQEAFDAAMDETQSDAGYEAYGPLGPAHGPSGDSGRIGLRTESDKDSATFTDADFVYETYGYLKNADAPIHRTASLYGVPALSRILAALGVPRAEVIAFYTPSRDRWSFAHALHLTHTTMDLQPGDYVVWTRYEVGHLHDLDFYLPNPHQPDWTGYMRGEIQALRPPAQTLDNAGDFA